MQAKLSISSVIPIVQEKKCPALYRWIGDYHSNGFIVRATKQEDYLVVLFVLRGTALVVQNGLSEHKVGEMSKFISYANEFWELCPIHYIVQFSN